MEEKTMTALISKLTEVGTGIFGVIPDITQLITDEPLLLLTVGFLFIGGAIGITGRLLSRS